MYIANVGDSRAIMSSSNGKVFALTTDHKPSNRFEYDRIYSGGGEVYQNSSIQKIDIFGRKV
jgi:serine/threonine protein phosphatase PrpC